MSLAKQGYIREGNIQHAVMDFYRYALEASNLDAADYFYQRVFHSPQMASRICRDIQRRAHGLTGDFSLEGTRAEDAIYESNLDRVIVLEERLREMVKVCTCNELKALAYHIVTESIEVEIPEQLKIHVDHFMGVKGKLKQTDLIQYIGGSKRNYQMAKQGLGAKWKW